MSQDNAIARGETVLVVRGRNLSEILDRLKAHYGTNEVHFEELDPVNLSVYVKGILYKQLWISKIKGEYRLYEDKTHRR